MKRNAGILIGSLLVLTLTLISGVASVQAQEKTIILATTTSTQDSGLLDVLIPLFEKNAAMIIRKILVMRNTLLFKKGKIAINRIS